MLSNWVIDREIFVREADKLRARFDENRGCANGRVTRLLRVRPPPLL